MPKRIHKTLLFMAIIAIIALFATNEVMAQDCSPPEICETNSGWTIDHIDGPTAVDHDNNAATPDLYQHTYAICQPGTGAVGEPACDPSGLNHFLIAIPVCCPDDIVIDTAPGFATPVCYPVAEGDPTLNWLLGYSQAFVCKLLPQPNGEWAFVTNTPAVGETSVALKSGQGKKAVSDYCSIIGPACFVESEPRSGGRSIQQSGIDYSLLFNTAGNSFDVDCPDCTRKYTLQMENLLLYIEGLAVGHVSWMPYDTPITSHASPDCIYVRTRSGGVKKVCD
jgi:hypothetical protein